MSCQREYDSPVVNCGGCTYTSLRDYNLGQPEAPLCSAIPSMATQVVPMYCPSGPGPNYPPKYNTLQHGGQGNCGGYFGVQGAYPYTDGINCATKFVARPCDGFIPCPDVEINNMGHWCP